MVSMHLAALILAAAGAGDTVLLDFRADWCGPCREMDPKIAQLAAAGYPVRKVNKDREPELAKRYRVEGIPCFVLLVNGKEVDRQVGATDVANLEAMFARAHVSPGDNRTRKKDAPSSEQLLAASVKLSIEDPKGISYGSGTLIDARDGSALVLTCGHIFRDSQGKGKITVDLFGPGGPKKIPGQLISYDLKRDIGLVSITPGVRVTVAHVAPKGYPLKRGDIVISVGCNHGQDPTVQESRVTATDKFLGASNVEVAGQPVQGRSGGGLFTSDGLVVGVCNAADPADDEGLFAAAGTIQSQLDEANLSELYAQVERGPARLASGAQTPRSLPVRSLEDDHVPPMPQNMPAPGVRVVSDEGGNGLKQLSPHERATLAEIQNRSQGAEVICIVRSLKDPQGKSEIIVLDRASSGFLEGLAAERSTQDARHLTSLDVPRREKQTVRR